MKTHEVDTYKEDKEKLAPIVLEMRKYPNRDDYTDEELDIIRNIDSGNKNASYETSKLDKILTKAQYDLGQNYLKSSKDYIENLKLDLEIIKLKTAIAWLQTRRPRFKSVAYGRAHATYINYRRSFNLHCAILEKNNNGKVEEVVGEWV